MSRILQKTGLPIASEPNHPLWQPAYFSLIYRMDKILKVALWHQFGTSIDMLENAIAICPESMWATKANFWYIAFDCYYLDYYLTPNVENYFLPAPFAFTGSDPTYGQPARIYTRQELLAYLHSSRTRCHELIAGMTSELATSTWTNRSKTMRFPFFELLLYNMRHVQHHTGQLNLLLRQGINDAPDWITRCAQ